MTIKDTLFGRVNPLDSHHHLPSDDLQGGLDGPAFAAPDLRDGGAILSARPDPGALQAAEAQSGAGSAGDPTGELWIVGGGSGAGNPDGSTDVRIVHADSDGQTNDQLIESTTNLSDLFTSVGLDTAANLFFAEDNDDNFYVGQISTGTILSTTTIASTSDEDVTNAFVVDPRTDTIYMDLFGGDYASDGGDIIKITYNPATGTISLPYDPSSFSIDHNQVLLDTASSGGIYQNGRSFVLSPDGSTLYYVDDDDNNPAGFYTGSTNGIYKVSTTGSVGGGNAPTPVLLSQQAQFPVDDSGGYLVALTFNAAQNLIYFTSADGSGNGPIWWMPAGGGAAHQMTLPTGVTWQTPAEFGNGITFDPMGRQLYLADDFRDAVVQLTLSADGKSFTAGNSNFYVEDSNAGPDGAVINALTWDTLPTESNFVGTTAGAIQGGAAITLLNGPPNISDIDGSGLNLAGVTVKIVGGTAGDGTLLSAGLVGDNLLVAGLQSGTVDGGKVAVSFNPATQTLTLTGDTTDADYRTLMSQVSFLEAANTDNSVGSHPTRTIDFIASDGANIVHGSTADSNEHTITITLDRAPIAGVDSYGVAKAGTVGGTGGAAGTGVLGNDSDPDGDVVSVGAVNGSSGHVGTSVQGTYGHLTLNADGSFSYHADLLTAIANAPVGSHPVDTFSYKASDGFGATTTQNVSFTIDRPGVANTDTISTLENSSAVSESPGVLYNDVDPDTNNNAGLSVTAVNGVAGNVGNELVLASGAVLTLFADGSYSYDPNHVFDYLGAGYSANDSFSYTITGGSTATVTVTINGVDSDDVITGTNGNDSIDAGIGNDVVSGLKGNDTLSGDDGDDNINGGPGSDTISGGNGNDTLNGGGGNDVVHGDAGNDSISTTNGTFQLYGDDGDDTIQVASFLRSGDVVDGGTGYDKLILNGDYSFGLHFAPTTMVNIEEIDLRDGFSYQLHLDDANVAMGAMLFVQGNQLTATHSLVFDGSHETDGFFRVIGGAGNDQITGGLGPDTLSGGAGNDTIFGGGSADILSGGTGADVFVYHSADDSSGSTYDRISDFDATMDKFDLWFTVKAVDPTQSVSSLSQLPTVLDAAHLGVHHAVEVTSGMHTYVVVDANGVAGYQTEGDLIIRVDGITGTLTTANFI